MARKKVVLMSDTHKVLGKMGTNIKRARLRRNISAEHLAEQAQISTNTLTAIEKGAHTVSLGAYAAVLSVLGMEKDLEQIAVDKEGKEMYPETGLFPRERARMKSREDET